MKLSTCTEWLFFHLWKKSPQSGTSCSGVFVADTVIYRWAQPYFRYFTASNGQIIRKTKDRVFIDQVESAFSEKEIVGVLLTSSQVNKQQEMISFEYFQKSNFAQFLYQREKDLNSILQKFIYPREDRNAMIKVSWSPQFCLLQRKTNTNDINGGKTLQERVCTFEGPEYLCESDSISSPLLSCDLEQLCTNIVKHVQEVSGGNIQIIRMVLYFKVDAQNRIWLLFCTGIKLRDKFKTFDDLRPLSPIFKVIRRDLEPVTLAQEGQKTLKISPDGFIEQLQYQSPTVCSNCDLQAIELYDLQFKHIIQSHKLVHNNFTRLPEELIKIKTKAETFNNKIKRREANNHYEIKNFYDSQQVLVDKYQISQIKKTEDQIQDDIQNLCNQLDAEQEDYKLNFDTVPILLLKVWGKLTEDKYKQLAMNPSWCDLKTKVCLECFLKFTECTNQTNIERKVQSVLLQLRKKVIDGQISEKQRNPNKSETHIFPPMKKPLTIQVQRQSIIQTIPVSPQKSNLTEQQKFLKVMTTKAKQTPTVSSIYKNRQGLNCLSLNQSGHSRSSKSTLDQSKLSHTFLLDTVSQLKKRLNELDLASDQKAQSDQQQLI